MVAVINFIFFAGDDYWTTAAVEEIGDFTPETPLLVPESIIEVSKLSGSTADPNLAWTSSYGAADE
jgi:hypothetical protein